MPLARWAWLDTTTVSMKARFISKSTGWGRGTTGRQSLDGERDKESEIMRACRKISISDGGMQQELQIKKNPRKLMKFFSYQDTNQSGWKHNAQINNN